MLLFFLASSTSLLNATNMLRTVVALLLGIECFFRCLNIARSLRSIKGRLGQSSWQQHSPKGEKIKMLSWPIVVQSVDGMVVVIVCGGGDSTLVVVEVVVVLLITFLTSGFEATRNSTCSRRR